MADVNILVAFGPSEDSFFLGVGRRACYNNIPQSLVDKINTGQLPVMETSWISIDKTGKYWCAEKFTGCQPTIFYELKRGSTLQQHIDRSGAQYVSFPEYDGITDDPPFFVKRKNRGNWNTSLPTHYSKAIKELQDTLPTFTDQLKWIIFGSGGTYLIQVDQGYIANVEGPHEDPNHLLNKVLTEFGNGAWNIDRGSTLCLYDHRYFYLKFKNARTGSVEMRYHLPPVMEKKVVELLALSRTAAEQHALLAEAQSIMSAAMQMQRDALSGMARQNALQGIANNTLLQGGVSILNATGGFQYELVQRGGR